jgi:hypothetical protein
LSTETQVDPLGQDAARREARETRNLILALVAIEGIVLVPLVLYLIFR